MHVFDLFFLVPETFDLIVCFGRFAPTFVQIHHVCVFQLPWFFLRLLFSSDSRAHKDCTRRRTRWMASRETVTRLCFDETCITRVVNLVCPLAHLQPSRRPRIIATAVHIHALAILTRPPAYVHMRTPTHKRDAHARARAQAALALARSDARMTSVTSPPPNHGAYCRSQFFLGQPDNRYSRVSGGDLKRTQDYFF